ncbi:hypothetical protein Zmor_003250 [Zophobas morio]|uniref:Uncharacterized protein n=1 Tax=Zophobas morio TaxID=2755281 RepID=A0AA38M1S3_9CUCU|nr:hypothetical protein Zmor_003210 [Zophobas morio]KAJ3639922.1 hypothetical protein Zmor_003250 [Zophobas morio]
MGSICSKIFDVPLDIELREIKNCLAHLLLQLSPDELITFALEDGEIYEICKEKEELRQVCILAAVRKYHREKFFYEEVYNRTAAFMVMLDNFVEIQDEVDSQEQNKKRFKYLSFLWHLTHERVGDAEKNGEK